MTEWNQALTAALGALPEFGMIDASDAKLSIVALMHDETPGGMARLNIGKTARWDNQTGTIRGVRTNPDRKGRLCYVVAGPGWTREVPVNSVEVVRPTEHRP